MSNEEEIKKYAIDRYGLTEEEFSRITPELMQDLIHLRDVVNDYQLVAEVVNSHLCAAGLKPGDIYVVKGRER